MRQVWTLGYVGNHVQHSTDSLQPHTVLIEIMGSPVYQYCWGHACGPNCSYA